jgi:hypothetical protein
MKLCVKSSEESQVCRYPNVRHFVQSKLKMGLGRYLNLRQLMFIQDKLWKPSGDYRPHGTAQTLP